MESTISRRLFFKHLLAIATFCSIGAVSLYAKVTKIVVKYQEKSTNGKMCKDCLHFIPETGECKLVEGKINPQGWCTFYLNKNTKKT